MERVRCKVAGGIIATDYVINPTRNGLSTFIPKAGDKIQLRFIHNPLLFWNVYGMTLKGEWWSVIVKNHRQYRNMFDPDKFFLEAMVAWPCYNRSTNRGQVIVAPVGLFYQVIACYQTTGLHPGDINHAHDFHFDLTACSSTLQGTDQRIYVNDTGFNDLKNIGLGCIFERTYNQYLFPYNSMVIPISNKMNDISHLSYVNTLYLTSIMFEPNQPADLNSFASNSKIVVPQFVTPSQAAMMQTTTSSPILQVIKQRHRQSDKHQFETEYGVSVTSGTCPDCKGKGKIQLLVSAVNCERCDGKGQV